MTHHESQWSLILAKIGATLASGLLAGAFLYASANIVPTFYEVPANVHLLFRVQLMKHNSLTMQSLMASSILASVCLGWLARHSRAARNLSLLAALLGVTCFLVTRFGNVPINGIMRSWSPTSPPIDWLQKLHRWDVFNSIRTIAAIGTFLCVSFAAQLTIGARSPAFPGASSERATKQK